MVVSEDGFGEGVGSGLVFSGEVQVDIGYLVAFESQEGFKRNVLSVSADHFPALGADLVRQVKAGMDGTVVHPFQIMAFAAQVVGLQRVDLRDAGHGGHKGGAH